MKIKLSIISILLVIVMALGVLSSCGNTTPATTEEPTKEQTTEAKTDAPTETVTQEQTEASESPSEETTEDISEQTSEATTEDYEEETTVEYTGEYASIINGAQSLANTIQEYRSNAKADSYFIENTSMKLEYVLKSSEDKLVSSLVNSEGKSYIENTFDAFVRVKGGGFFRSSGSPNEVSVNTFRFGYYYDEFRVEGQNFVNGFEIRNEVSVNLSSAKNSGKTNLKSKYSGGVITAEIKGSDPYFSFEGLNLPADEYAYAKITLRTTDDNSSGAIYIAAGSYDTANAVQIVDFDIFPADEQFHTYIVYLGSVKDYTGTLKSIRLDFNGMEEGKMVEISEIKIVSADEVGLSSLSTARIFHVYSDKLHHELQVVAHYETADIEAIGMKTEILADTVEKLIVKDANGLHETLDGVDWDSAEYIGFDIIDVGVFGYILPVHETTGKMTVTLEDGRYVIIQERTPEGNTLVPGDKDEIGNTNDFYIGQRLYTDENHTFDAFLKEAEIERNPLTAKNIKVSTAYSDNGKFLGYDAIRGCYVFSVEPGGFNHNYYKAQNKHYEINVTIKSDEYDRNLYILNTAGNSGELECAALLDANLMILPIPLEVGKNFSGDGDNTIYDQLDSKYSEVIFPIYLSSEEMFEFSVVNLYQNWGNYPLKQASSIEFFSPYYHLSTGVTETNCINYEHSTSMLPDHRAMSAPLWSSQPQHTSGGQHSFLTYLDNADSNQILYNIYKAVDSYGPTYANVITKYMTADNKILATLEHTEMPQTDENRGYYTITYEFVEDISFDNFKNQVNLYSVSDNDPKGTYQLFGYLNENNEPTIVKAKINGPETTYVLGNECPYFDYCNMTGYAGAGGSGYVNVSFIICNSEIIMGGEKITPRFVVKEGNLFAKLSLDLGKVDFKAGDKITINALITPWGSQESDYSGTEFAPDQNVRDMRENSALDPFKITAGESTKVIQSAFVPKVKTTNGKSAEFTISGGENNVAIRVYGFTKLTSPKIYELIDGEWVVYDVSSANKPDNSGYRYAYDGYMVYYDENGTFSYSFVTTITDGAPRTFKVEADSDFEKLTRLDPADVRLTPYNVYVDSADLARAAATWPLFSHINGGSSGEIKYTSLHGSPKCPESYLPPFTNNVDKETGIGETVTGQYIVVKYRVPENTTDDLPYFQFFAGTEATTATGKGDNVIVPNGEGFYADGNWHVLIVDLSASGMSSIISDNEGNYRINFIRFDVFNAAVAEESHIDFAYFAIHDSLEEIYEANSDMGEVTLFQNKMATQIDTATGQPVQ